MPRKLIHLGWYPESRVFCDGQLVLKVGSVRESLHIDVWSGTHPAYVGSRILDLEGRVERFLSRYAAVEGMNV